MAIPSTPARHATMHTDPFSSPARGVGWSPGASMTLLDGLSRDGSVFRPSMDVESVLDMNVSPVRRAGNGQISSGSPFAPYTPRAFRRSRSFQSHGSFVPDNASSFLASSSPFPFIPRSPSAPPTEFSFYGAESDANELDKYYQLASPPSGPSLASIHAHSPAPHSAPPSTPAPGSSTANFSSPMFPPPASPPPFASHIPSRAHTFSHNEYSAPYLSSPVPSQAAPPLPPSSPIPYTSSPFEDDPFFVRTNPGNSRARTDDSIGTRNLEVTGLVGSPSYILPNIESSHIPRSSRLVHRRGRCRTDLTDPLAGVTKSSRAKGKAATRGRNKKLGVTPHSDTPNLSYGYEEQVSRSSSRVSAPYISSTSTIRTLSQASLLPDVCAATSTSAPISFQVPFSSLKTPSRFIFPTPATTISLGTPSDIRSVATPSTIGYLNTPASTSLLRPVEISDAACTPTGAVIPYDEIRRTRPLRFATQSPMFEPKATKDLVIRSANIRTRDICDKTPTRTEYGVESGSQESPPCVGQDPVAVESNPRLRGNKRTFKEDEDTDYPHIGKRIKAMTRGFKGEMIAKTEPVIDEIEPYTPVSEIPIDRPTRSRTRAMAALLESNSVVSGDKKTRRVAHVAEGSKIGRGITKGKVAGRAPSRAVIASEGQAVEDSTDDIKQEEGTMKDELEDDFDTKVNDSPEPTSSPKKRIHPSDLLPRPDRSIIFAPDGNIVQRTFPKDFPINKKYIKLYRRFPVSTYFQENDPARAFVLGNDTPKSENMQPYPSNPLKPNPAQHFNLYTPRFVRGSAYEKVGMCAICIEPVWRGGEGKLVFLNTKISAYNYHMQYYHGICSKTGLPFSPPTAFRYTSRIAGSREKSEVEEGMCHSCEKWIPVDTVKDLDALVPELYWWKHAASCHGTTRIEGDKDLYLEDAAYLLLKEFESKVNGKTNDQGENDKQGGTNVLVDPEDITTNISPESDPASLDILQVDTDVKPGAAPSNETLPESVRMISANIFGTMDSDSDLTDLEDDE